jgi:hypothetical protein
MLLAVSFYWEPQSVVENPLVNGYLGGAWVKPTLRSDACATIDATQVFICPPGKRSIKRYSLLVFIELRSVASDIPYNAYIPIRVGFAERSLQAFNHIR